MHDVIMTSSSHQIAKAAGLKNCAIRNIAFPQHLLHPLAIDTSFSSSSNTLVPSDNYRVMLALVDTHRIEAILARKGKILVHEDYVHELVRSANHKLDKSRRRMEALRLAIEKKLT